MAVTIDSLLASLRGSMVWRLIALNVALYVVLHLLSTFSGVSVAVAGLLELPAGLSRFASCPWSMLTYMFVQVDFLHLAVNMLLLYCFGTMLARVSSGRTLIWTYLAGGLTGAILFVMAGSLFSGAWTQTRLIGASGAVMAVMMAVTVITPSLQVSVFPLSSPVRLVWVTAAILLIELVSLLMSGNGGGHLAHLGGVIAGTVTGLVISHRERPARRRVRKAASASVPTVDSIIDKIRTSGHKSLTPEERRIFFNISKTNENTGL